ncbi:photosystem II repair protein PSB27-H1, chloroplastic [Curcuma longa]|uniref:photosystem II repair protein PSB27-H1, chloroplastic n=1 Tax=Curcuma longa TaxID=136217 RepID=UPI003D9E8B0B
MASSSPLLTPPTSKPSPSLTSLSARPAAAPSSFAAANAAPCCARAGIICRRELLAAAIFSPAAALLVLPPAPALASDDEEYVKETAEMINRLRSTISMDKTDPNVATAVAELREASNTWVAKYRREKALLGRASFRDIYSALNAVSGHYISFGPTAPIPTKRKARILEEVDTAEKALLRGR